MKIIVIGGGAAGFFAAIRCKEVNPSAEVIILESTTKVLSKVAISGGGRCNVTTGIRSINDLIQQYPRGGKQLKKAFYQFGPAEMENWLQAHGVVLKTEQDGRMFPITDDSATIVECLRNTASESGVILRLKSQVKQLKNEGSGWTVEVGGVSEQADKIILTTGGNIRQLQWLSDLGQKIESPCPSLFTFRIDDSALHDLKGVAVAQVQASIVGQKLKTTGPLLVTHWGLSGPAILRLSAFGAKWMHDQQYQFKVAIQWWDGNQEELRDWMLNQSKDKSIGNTSPSNIPNRMWKFLLARADINPDMKWVQFSKKAANKLIEVLTNDQYEVNGKTTFKEEFVTCGGVDLSGVSLETFESKVLPGLYFAGEVLNIDGVTGGFNFQAAWTTAYLSASDAAQSVKV